MTRCAYPGCPHEAVELPECRSHLSAAGGKARAAKLSPERPKEIAPKARQTRKPSPNATSTD